MTNGAEIASSLEGVVEVIEECGGGGGGERPPVERTHGPSVWQAVAIRNGVEAAGSEEHQRAEKPARYR